MKENNSLKNFYTFLFILIMTIFLIGQADITFATERNELINKIAFLHQQEVWLINQDGSGLKQFTHTGGKVLDFLFSPSLGYFAYFLITGYTDDWWRILICFCLILQSGRSGCFKTMPVTHNFVEETRKFLHIRLQSVPRFGILSY